jgi:hypothetical protein
MQEHRNLKRGWKEGGRFTPLVSRVRPSRCGREERSDIPAAKAAQEINREADEQNQAQSAAAISRAAEVKTAAAAQQEQDEQDDN